MELYISLLCFLIAFLYTILRRDSRINRKMSKFTGPPELPVLGHLHYFLRPKEEYLPILFKSFVDNYRPVVRIWMGPWLPYGCICDTAIAEKLLSTTSHIDKGKFSYDKMRPWLGDGLLTSSKTAMGKKINAQTSETNKIYIDAVNEISELIMDKILSPWKELPILSFITGISRREKRCIKILHQFTNDIIKMKKAEAAKRKCETVPSSSTSNLCFGKQRKAFLDLLLEYSDEGRVLSDADIREEVYLFMFAGHDTTAVNMSWVILMLAANPNVQDLVHSELDAIFGDNPERDVTPWDVAQMKYLECCIKETLRLYPSAPFIMRQTDEDIVIEDGRVIPKGITAIVPIYFIHRDSRYHPDPLTFKPERFMEDEGKSRNPFAYIPFSAGPRNCIGQKFALLEEKIVLAKLFRQFRVEADAELVKNVVEIPDLVLRSRDGIHVKLFKRK